MTPKDFEDACKQPVTISTAIVIFIMLIVHMLGMYAWILKMDKIFNPDRVLAKERTHRFVERITNTQQKNRYNKKKTFHTGRNVFFLPE